MAVLITAALLAIAVIALSIGFHRLREIAWAARLAELELQDNCLLTRYPIAFLVGSTTVFRPIPYWNNIPNYLREHGYEVILLQARSRIGAQSLNDALSGLPTQCHIVADSSTEAELRSLAQVLHPNVATLTLVKNSRSRKESSIETKALRPILRVNIDIFKIEDVKVRWSLANFLSLLLLTLHNLLSFQRGAAVDALETAQLETSERWDLEARFLKLAVGLAERDAMGLN